MLLELDCGRLGGVSRSALFKFVVLNRVISSLHLRRSRRSDRISFRHVVVVVVVFLFLFSLRRSFDPLVISTPEGTMQRKSQSVFPREPV
jgi:hypothetical protein